MYEALAEQGRGKEAISMLRHRKRKKGGTKEKKKKEKLLWSCVKALCYSSLSPCFPLPKALPFILKTGFSKGHSFFDSLMERHPFSISTTLYNKWISDGSQFYCYALQQHSSNANSHREIWCRTRDANHRENIILDFTTALTICLLLTNFIENKMCFHCAWFQTI